MPHSLGVKVLTQLSKLVANRHQYTFDSVKRSAFVFWGIILLEYYFPCFINRGNMRHCIHSTDKAFNCLDYRWWNFSASPSRVKAFFVSADFSNNLYGFTFPFQKHDAVKSNPVKAWYATSALHISETNFLVYDVAEE